MERSGEGVPTTEASVLGDGRQWSEMAGSEKAQGGDPSEVPAPRRDRRGGESDRRYNRRSPASDLPPPYYEVFTRIADALEGVERALAPRSVDLNAREHDPATR